MKKEKYIFVYSKRHEEYELFNDIKQLDNVRLIVCEQKPIKSKFLKLIRSIHTSGEIADYVRLPFKKLWYKNTDISIRDDEYYYLIIIDKALEGIQTAYLQQLAKRENVKSILVLINAMGSSTIRHIKGDIDAVKWDKIYTFDEKDAEKYGFDKLPYHYYSKRDEGSFIQESAKQQKDLYYIGLLQSGREKTIMALYEYLQTHGVNAEFHLMQSKLQSIKKWPYKNEIDYFTSKRGLIPYKDVLAAVINSKTILELVKETQSGPTLRYFEAICYNKKLLTNNRNIVNFPLYNSRYMRVFNTVDDIDIDWLRSDEEVDYHYANEFSPCHLLEKIHENEI